MTGYEIVFMTPAGRTHRGRPILDAVIDLAAEQGIRGYTRRDDTDSRGVDGRSHSAHFFELADQPEEVAFVADERQSDALLHAVERAGMNVFAMRSPIEYWQFGGAD